MKYFSNNPVGLRISFDVILLCIVFALPWWCALIVGIAGLFYFPSFYELLVLGVIIDSLYNAPVARLYRFQFVVTLIVTVIFIVFNLLKTRIRYYR